MTTRVAPGSPIWPPRGPCTRRPGKTGAMLSAVVCLAVASTPQSHLQELDAFVTRSMPVFKVPGAAIAVIENGKIVHLKGFGVRNIETKEPVDENTIFQMASVSKTFTATLAATLVQAGKFGWDTPIYNVLPEFVFPTTYGTRWITMRDLLAHRTGWPQFTGDMLDNLGYDRPEILRRLRYLQPACSLRESANYSNPSFFVAGEVCARADGGTWNTALENRVLKPLGMTRTFASMKAIERPNSSVNHGLVDGKVALIEPSDQDTMGAAGGVTSTAADLAKLLLMYVNGDAILEPKTIEEVFARAMVVKPTFTEQPPISEATGFYYGMGVGSFDWADVQVIEKGGALAGVRTIIVIVPEKKAAIAVLSNMNLTTFPEAVRAFWLGKLMNRNLDQGIEAITKTSAAILTMMEVPPAPANPKPFGGTIEGLLGVYENDLYGKMEVARQGDSLTIYGGPARYPGRLRHLDGGLFGVKFPGATTMEADVHFTLGAKDVAEAMSIETLGTFQRRK